MNLIDGCGIVNRNPDLSQSEIIQSVVFLRDYGWTYLKAIKWLDENDYYSDMADVKKSQIRFRQYNPDSLHDGYYVSKKINTDDKPINLIIFRKNNIEGNGFMLNNKNILTNKERFNSFIDLFTKRFLKTAEIEKKKNIEKNKYLDTVRKANKKRLKTVLKK